MILTFTAFSIFLLSAIFGMNFTQFGAYEDEYEDQIDPNSSSDDIDIITPENKTYIKGMKGYYPATFGCEDIINGFLPIGWEGNSSGTGCSAHVIETYNQHNKVIKLEDTSTTTKWRLAYRKINDIDNGTVEFWLNSGDASDGMQFLFLDNDDPNNLRIQFRIENNKWQYDYGSGFVNIPGLDGVYDPVDNKWYHIHIDFESTLGSYCGLGQYKWSVTIDGYNSAELPFKNNGGGINQFYMYSGDAQIDTKYLDAIGFSWDPNYEVGDNLKEGLFLSFNDTVNCQNYWYSLDGGVNRTILGNTTLLLPSEGRHSIQIFGNDSFGSIYSSNIVGFTYNSINIVTPENKTYKKAMGGYYPGTFSFDNIIAGAEDPHWFDGDNDGYIYDEIDGHKKVYGIYDTSASNGGDISQDFDSSKNYGTIEGWIRFTSVTEGCDFRLNDEDIDVAWLAINGGTFKYLDNTGSHDIIGAPIPQVNQWYHLRFDFRGSYNNTYQGIQNQYAYKIFIDGKTYGAYNYSSNVDINRFRVHTLISGSGFSTYWDAIGYSWDPSYSIGDNMKEGLLLSFEDTANCQSYWYFLDGGVNRTIFGNTTFPLPSEGNHTVQVFGNDSLGNIYSSNVVGFTYNLTKSINIITPENKTYDGAMNGYYPATYGFENDTIGSYPSQWTIQEDYGTIQVIDSFDSHKKVVELYDYGYQKQTSMINSFTPQTAGVVEFWWGADNAHELTIVNLMNGDSPVIHLTMHDNEFYYTGGGIDFATSIFADNNRLYYNRIEFNCSLNLFDWYINDQLVVDDGLFRDNSTFVDSMRFITGWSASSVRQYVDAIGYSWDPTYDIGKNLYEGILLDFNCSFKWNWIGYSLDGQTNKSIDGDLVLEMPAVGIHSLQLFANDSYGKMISSRLRFFTILPASPELNILSPDLDDYFGNNSPFYQILIDQENINSKWYSLDNGITNITFNQLNGYINQTEWLKLEDGNITIKFYAENAFGQIGYSSISIIKDSVTPTVIVNSPNMYKIFGNIAPDLDVSINDLHIDSIWFNTNTSLENYTFSGIFNQNIWESIPDGHILVNFYANDTAGNMGYDSLIIIKDSTTPIIQINAPINYALVGREVPILDVQVLDSHLDSCWYSLDDGLTNYSFSGTINQNLWDLVPDGLLTIRFYAKDIVGNLAVNSIILEKDATNPIITIIAPTQGEELKEIPPIFEIEIEDDNLQHKWYTIDQGQTNFTINQLTDVINQEAWNAASNGIVRIRFYAEDKAGNVMYKDVFVVKNVPNTPPSSIPGPNIYITLLMVSFSIAIITLRTLKKKWL
ncbi:MAG: hypothetical protein P8Y97_06530, partial [Candidatus Lokiarchaeota archaeon]